MDRKGGEVTVRSTAGAEIKRNPVSFVTLKYQEKSLEAKVNVEPIHQEEEGTNQAGVAKRENELPNPGLTGSSMPVQQTPVSSPLKQMASPRATRNVRRPKRFDDYELSKG